MQMSKEFKALVDETINELAGATIEIAEAGPNKNNFLVNFGPGESKMELDADGKTIHVYLSTDTDADLLNAEDRHIHYMNRLMVISFAIQSTRFPLHLLVKFDREPTTPANIRDVLKRNPKYFAA